MITNEMDQLKAEFVKLEKAVQHIHTKLNEMHGALIGNPLTLDGGLSRRLSRAEEQLDELEERLNVAEKKQLRYNVYVIVMWTCVGGAASFMFAYILQLFFKLK